MTYLPGTSRHRPRTCRPWVAVFVLAIGALLASCGPPGRHSAEPQAAHPCQAAQLRASLPGDSGHAGIEEVTFGLTNESPEVCVLNGVPAPHCLDRGAPAVPLRCQRFTWGWLE